MKKISFRQERLFEHGIKVKVAFAGMAYIFLFFGNNFLAGAQFLCYNKAQKNYKKIKKTSKKFKKTIDILKYMRYNNKAVENNI